MQQSFEVIWRTVLIGGGATLITDLWALLSAALGLPTMNFRMLGRWVGHLVRGTMVHASIAASPPIARETAIGWVTHYAVGVLFAALLVLLAGTDWLAKPRLVPALLFGLATLAAPFLVLQPAMGAGFASLRTASPTLNIARSTITHLIFGAGLYLAASMLVRMSA